MECFTRKTGTECNYAMGLYRRKRAFRAETAAGLPGKDGGESRISGADQTGIRRSETKAAKTAFPEEMRGRARGAAFPFPKLTFQPTKEDGKSGILDTVFTQDLCRIYARLLQEVDYAQKP
ncbi:MAG: hypothetical protein Q4D81_10730 [Eubacteriales bacterium]|nr:hypothetical protein [Eubacteriales bacterium]